MQLHCTGISISLQYILLFNMHNSRYRSMRIHRNDRIDRPILHVSLSHVRYNNHAKISGLSFSWPSCWQSIVWQIGAGATSSWRIFQHATYMCNNIGYIALCRTLQKEVYITKWRIYESYTLLSCCKLIN